MAEQNDLGARYRVEFDGFVGTVIGFYKRLDGEEGVVMQQDGCKVVHVYRRKWLVPADGVPEAPATTKHPDTVLLDFIASEYLDVSAFSMLTGADDADVGWKLHQEHMGAKGRFEVACHHSDDLRAAIREAMLELGYMPPDVGVKEVGRG